MRYPEEVGDVLIKKCSTTLKVPGNARLILIRLQEDGIGCQMVALQVLIQVPMHRQINAPDTCGNKVQKVIVAKGVKGDLVSHKGVRPKRKIEKMLLGFLSGLFPGHNEPDFQSGGVSYKSFIHLPSNSSPFHTLPPTCMLSSKKWILQKHQIVTKAPPRHQHHLFSLK